MSDWLSSTWEASWRPFQYFNFYRLLLAVFVLLTGALPESQMASLQLTPVLDISLVIFTYLGLVLGGLALSINWQHHFNKQLSAQVFTDVFFVSLLMVALGGVSSGMGTVLLVSLAAASLVGRGRLVLFYAAVATLATLLVQIFSILTRNLEAGTLLQAGMLSAGFFATAILARLLGQRVMINEELARQRGEALENQSRISQRVVERMQDGVLVIDREARVQRCNPMAEIMLGPLPVGALLQTRAPTLAAALIGDQGHGSHIELVGVDGQRLQARFEKTASTSGEMLIYVEDVGRILEQAQQLKLASLGRLTASIAHEIRNPLSAISHAGELLREERRGAMQDRLLRILNDNVVRLDRIVKDVLELGRQNRAQPELIALNAFCANFIDDFLAADNLPSGMVRLAPSPALSICFDRAHLHQVLWNLVSNACRHSTQSPGAVRLEVSASSTDGRVELHVVDDGPGVPEAVRTQIFEPFFTSHHQGTGLGLFIARELCAANGASLELMPSVEHGHFMITGRNDTCL